MTAKLPLLTETPSKVATQPLLFLLCYSLARIAPDRLDSPTLSALALYFPKMEKTNIAAARSPIKLAELIQDKPKTLLTVTEGFWDPDLFSRYERATKTYVR